MNPMEAGQRKDQFESKSLGELKQIVKRDYGMVLSDTEAGQFGLSLLKITRLALNVFNRADDTQQLINYSQ